MTYKYKIICFMPSSYDVVAKFRRVTYFFANYSFPKGQEIDIHFRRAKDT